MSEPTLLPFISLLVSLSCQVLGTNFQEMKGGWLLESKRLGLRPIGPEDKENLFRLDSDSRVMRYIGPVKTDLEQMQRVIDYLADYSTKNPGLGLFAAIAKDSDDFIGWFELAHLDKTTEIELGYRLLPEYWGRGYASEGSAILRDYAFGVLKLDRIVGITHHDNLASQRVLQKTGLRYEKGAHHYNLDVKYFALNRKEYKHSTNE